MRVIKPFAVSLSQRLFVWRQQARLSVALFHHFPFQAPQVPLPEIPMWQGLMAALGDVIPDEGLPKTRGEILLAGRGYAPGSVAVPVFAVALKVRRGEAPLVDKQVAVIGPRCWGTGGPTDPEPIGELPLSWEHAFGGEDYPPNPKGMGLSPTEEDGTQVHRLPQLEDPRALIRSPQDRPAPACFLPLDPTLRSRLQQMGTYDSKWLQTDFPGFARDMSDEFFQVAPQDQRIDGYWQGGETIEIRHAHPREPVVRTEVPRLRARCFVKQRGRGDDDELREVVTRAETLICLPNTQRGIVIHRGVLDVADDDGADVTLMLAALEHADRPKPRSHYVQAVAQRLDPEKGHLFIVKEKDLLPARDPGTPKFADESFGDMESIIEREGAVEQRMRARAESLLAQARVQAQILGLDPDEHVPKALPPPGEKPTLDELSEYMQDLDRQVEDERLRAEKLKRLAEEQQRHTADILGLDYEAMVAEGQRSGGGPPAWSAEAELEKLRDLAEMGRNAGMPFCTLEEQLADPELKRKLELMEQQLLFTYRKLAHHYPAASAEQSRHTETIRVTVQAAVDSETSLARQDLTGVDLSGMNLAGADLEEALLEGANLAGCDLSRANLKGAVLVRANLSETVLSDADLGGANLGHANAAGAQLCGANLATAVLHGCRLQAATLSGANLYQADLTEAVLAGADLRGLQAPEAMFYEMDFSEADFTGAHLPKALFCKCQLRGARFATAMLEEACFADSDVRSADFNQAKLSRSKSVGETTFAEADFTEAVASTSNFRGVDLRGASFARAVVEASDFSGADATGARFTQLKGRGSSFVRTDLTDADLSEADLMEALLLKARLDRAKLLRANLFRANLLQARGVDPSFRGAHVKRALYRKEEP